MDDQSSKNLLMSLVNGLNGTPGLEKAYEQQPINKFITKYHSHNKYFYLINEGNAINFINNGVVGSYITLVQAETILCIHDLLTKKQTNKMHELNEKERKNVAKQWLHYREINETANPISTIIKNAITNYLSFFSVEKDELHLFTQQLANDTDIVDRNNYTGHVTASAFILSANKKKFLIIYNKHLNLWLLPGGHAKESDISEVWRVAYQKVVEEIGLKNIYLHQWHNKFLAPIDINTHYIPENKTTGEPGHYHHDLRYVFLLSGKANFRLDKQQIGDIQWRPIDEYLEFFLPKQAQNKIRSLLLR